MVRLQMGWGEDRDVSYGKSLGVEGVVGWWQLR